MGTRGWRGLEEDLVHADARRLPRKDPPGSLLKFPMGDPADRHNRRGGIATYGDRFSGIPHRGWLRRLNWTLLFASQFVSEPQPGEIGF
jgi:hypothetical protein